jgi:hypothetical protein
MALIKVVLYATLSLTAYTANRVDARFSLRLLSSRIVRPCCLVDRCQSFGVTSCLQFQDARVIVRSCSFVDTKVWRNLHSSIFVVEECGASQVFGNVSGPLSSG